MIRKKKIFVVFSLILMIILISSITGCKSIPITNEPIEAISKPASGSVLFLDQSLKLSSPLYFESGRLYLPLLNIVNTLGGKVVFNSDTDFKINWKQYSYDINASDDTYLSHPLCFENGVAYISLYDFAELFDLSVLIHSDTNQIALYHKDTARNYMDQPNPSFTKAFLRLEDITSTGGTTGNLTDENLEKLRAMADYLNNRGQSFYIAWIPLYTNPPAQIVNDLTKDFSFYNADFLFTLDYMTHHGGHIVLHGLTHQENDTISAIGTEFGDKTPFSKQEIESRMQKAKDIAKFFGYEDNMFEFPHYKATKQQLKIAEKYFDVIYQQNYQTKNLGNIVKVKSSPLHYVYYVPTPLDFVHSAEGLPDTLDNIENLPGNQLPSLFFHPYLDFDQIECSTSQAGIRSFTYNDSAILPQIVNKITERNWYFSTIDMQ